MQSAPTAEEGNRTESEQRQGEGLGNRGGIDGVLGGGGIRGGFEGDGQTAGLIGPVVSAGGEDGGAQVMRSWIGREESALGKFERSLAGTVANIIARRCRRLVDVDVDKTTTTANGNTSGLKSETRGGPRETSAKAAKMLRSHRPTTATKQIRGGQ